MEDIEPHRVFWPYCAQRIGEDNYVLLGRDYKPVGIITKDWVHYEQHPIVYEVEGLTPDVAAQISFEGSTNVERIYFFDDRSAPWRGEPELKAYEKRLAQFLALLVVRSLKRPACADTRASGGIGTSSELRAT
jgi:hypothetical protein